MPPTAQAVGILFLKSPSPEGSEEKNYVAPAFVIFQARDSAACNVPNNLPVFPKAFPNVTPSHPSVTPFLDTHTLKT